MTNVRELLVKSTIGLCAVLAVMGLILFAAAGSLAFVQAWLYLAVFGLCTALITLYLAAFDRGLLARRVAGGPTAEHRPTAKVISAVANLLLLALYVVAGLDARFGWSQVPTALSSASDVLVIVGFGIVLFTFRANSYTSATVTVAEEQPLIDDGPYGVVRHPMYAGVVLLVLATPVALGSWFALSLVPPFVAAIAARLLDEEQYLAAHLAGYKAYRARVPYRLVPFVW